MRFDHDAIVTFLQQNPKRSGSTSAVRYEVYKHAGTMGEALRLGALRSDLKHDFDHGFVAIDGEGASTHAGTSVNAGARKRARMSKVEPMAEVIDDWAAEALPGCPSNLEESGAAAPRLRRQWRLRGACSPVANGLQTEDNDVHSVQPASCNVDPGVGSFSRGTGQQARMQNSSPIVITSPDPKEMGDPIRASPVRKRAGNTDIRSQLHAVTARGASDLLSPNPLRRQSKVLRLFGNKNSSPRRVGVCGFTVSPARRQADMNDSDVRLLTSPARKKMKTKILASPLRAALVTPFPRALQFPGEMPCFFASEIAGLAGLHPYSTALDVLVRCWRRHNLATFRSWERSTGGSSLPEVVFARHATANVHAAVAEAVKAGNGAIPKEAEEKIREAVRSSAPAGVQKAVFDEAMGRAKRTRGTGLEATGLDAYELKYGRRVVRRNQDKLVKSFGGFKLSGRVDGFEEVSGQRWVVEHKRRQRRLFRDVPRYEQVQCQAYMAMAGVKACRWVQTMGPEVGARSLGVCPLRWACIEGRLTAMAGFAKRLFGGGFAPPAAELGEMQAACWEAAPPWPDGPMPKGGAAADGAEESDDSQLTEDEKQANVTTVATSCPMPAQEQTGADVPSKAVEAAEATKAGAVDLEQTPPPHQHVVDESEAEECPRLHGTVSSSAVVEAEESREAGMFCKTDRADAELLGDNDGQMQSRELRAASEQEARTVGQSPACGVSYDDLKSDGRVAPCVSVQDRSMTLKETTLTLREATLTLKEATMAMMHSKPPGEVADSSPRNMAKVSDTELTATLKEDELTLPDSNFRNECPTSPAPSTVLDCSSDEEGMATTLTLLENCPCVTQMAY